MAKIENTLIGHAHGCFGTGVFFTQFGYNLIKKRPTSYSPSISDAALLRRQIHTAFSIFLKVSNRCVEISDATL